MADSSHAAGVLLKLYELRTEPTLRQARARFESEYIAAVLQHHRGRIADAAKVLGVQRTNLYRKMRRLNLMRPRGWA